MWRVTIIGGCLAALLAMLIHDYLKEVVKVSPVQAPRQIGDSNEGSYTGGGKTQDSSGTSRQEPPPQPPAQEPERRVPSTELYQLSTSRAGIEGKLFTINLSLRSTSDQPIAFRLAEPYVLTSKGARLEAVAPDSAGFFENGVVLLPGTTLQTDLQFCSMSAGKRGYFSERYSGAVESICSGKSIKGDKFTFIAQEILPRSGATVELKVLSERTASEGRFSQFFKSLFQKPDEPSPRGRSVEGRPAQPPTTRGRKVDSYSTPPVVGGGGADSTTQRHLSIRQQAEITDNRHRDRFSLSAPFLEDFFPHG